MTTTTKTSRTTKFVAGLVLGLTLLGLGTDGAEAAMLDSGRVRLSTSSGVNA